MPDDLAIQRLADRLDGSLRDTFLSIVTAIAAGPDADELNRLVEAEDIIGIIHLWERTIRASLTIHVAQMESALSNVVTKAASTATTVAGFTGSLTRTSATTLAWLRNESSRLVVGISTESMLSIRRLLSAGYVAGTGVRPTARQIRAVVGLLPSHASAVTRYAAELVEREIPQERIDAFVETYTRRLLAYRADNIARTEAMTAVHIGQNAAWLHLVEQGFLDPRRAWMEWMTATDDRVCFPAGTMVSTPRGEHPIETIVPGDTVLTPQGEASVYATTMRNNLGRWVAVWDSTGRITVSTDNHEFWSSGWTRAKNLRVGNSVGDKGHHVIGLVEFGVSDASNGVALLGKLGITQRVLNGVMPVDAINLQNQVDINEEVHVASSNGEILLERNSHLSQSLPNQPLGSGLPIKPEIASTRAESMSSTWSNPKRTATLLARLEEWGSIASLRTEFLSGPRSLVFSPATEAGSWLQNNTPSTIHGTKNTLRFGGRGNNKCLVTFGADLLDSTGYPKSEVTSTATESSFSGTPKRNSTALTDKNWMDNSALVKTGAGAENLCLSSLEISATLLARQVNQFLAFCRSLTEGNREVYDISVTETPVFYANGLLVHNCPLCAPMDGKRVRIGHPFISDTKGFPKGFPEAVASPGGDRLRKGPLKPDPFSMKRHRGRDRKGKNLDGFTVPLPTVKSVPHPPLHPSCRCTLRLVFDGTVS